MVGAKRISPHSMFMISAIIGIALAGITAIILRGKRQRESAIKIAQSPELVTEVADSEHDLAGIVRSAQ
jgi:hypothetical protein